MEHKTKYRYSLDKLGGATKRTQSHISGDKARTRRAFGEFVLGTDDVMELLK